MGVVKGTIGIKDNATAVLRGIRKEQSAFKKEVESTRKELSRTWDKKWKARVESTTAAKKMRQLHKAMQPLRKKIATVVAIKDMATAKLKEIKNKVKAVGKMVASPIVKLKNHLSAGISKAKGMLKSAFKSVVIPVTLAATVATAAFGGAVKSGMELEQQQISMKHFIGATNKGMSDADVQKVADSFTQELRNNANATPFETGEVIAAGSRAVSIASGDTKEAMSLVKLAEDMAAASGGTKSIKDAMEALADAKLGETERLKEFGFKVSADEFKEKGFEGVSKDLEDFYGGAAAKLANSGAGLMSTIKGKLKSSLADFGLNVVEKLKPVMVGVIGFIDKIAPQLEKFSTTLADGIGRGIEAVVSFVPKLKVGMDSVKPIFANLAQTIAPSIGGIVNTVKTAIPSIFPIFQQLLQAVVPVIGTIFSTINTVLPTVLPVLSTVLSTVSSVISAAAPIISGMVEGIGTVVSTLAPVFQTIFSAIGEKVGSVISFVSERMGFIQEVISTVSPIIGDIISTAWGVIEPVIDIAVGAFKILFSVVQKVFPGIKSVIETVWNFIKPLVEGIGKVMHSLASGWDWLVGKVTGGGKSEPGKNAKGTNNWKGGVTWVGEEGPELIDLPRGTRILPHKESTEFVKPRPVKEMYQASAGEKSKTRESVQPIVKIIPLNMENMEDRVLPHKTSPTNRSSKPVGDTFQVPVAAQSTADRKTSAIEKKLNISIAKLADSIVVREEADIDRIGDAVAKKVVEVALNIA